MNARQKTNRKPNSSVARRRRRAQKRTNALSFEILERRQLLAAITVGNNTDILSPTADTSSIAALAASDGGDGISLREAIVAANNTAGEDSITFDAGVFTGGDNSLIGLTQGELEISDSLSIDASSATDVVITGGRDSRVLNFSAPTGNLTLTSLTITGGETRFSDESSQGGGIRFESVGTLTVNQSNVSGNSASGTDGGGIYTSSGDVLISNSTISGNSARYTGGGIYTSSGDVSISNSTISGNSANSDGGGIRTSSGNVFLINSIVNSNSSSSFAFAGPGHGGGGISTVSGDVSLTNSTVSGNSSGSSCFECFGEGGGISTSSGDLTLTNSTVSGNRSAGDGGGIITDSGNVSLTRSTVSDNNGGIGFFYNYRGGGINAHSGTVSLTSSTVSGNSVGNGLPDPNGPRAGNDYGGGIYTGRGDISLTNSTVSGNDSGVGLGGGFFTAFGNISLTNSTVSGNSSGSGGGIFSFGFDGDLLLTNSTVTGNSASERGGGISVSRLTLHNSIVAGNSADGTAPDTHSSLATIIENSLIGNTAGSRITATSGSGNILNQPALLGPLADNGGPTQTHALLPGSPAINAGNDALALDENGNPLTTDQRGEARFEFGGRVDIGAYEGVFLLGDVDRDGDIDLLDIVPFISLISDSVFLNEADIDGNGVVNFLDIAPFISLLSSGGSALSSELAASVVSSESDATSEVSVVDLPDSPAVPLVLVSEPASITSVASTVEVPLATETSQVKTGASKLAPVSPNVTVAKPHPPKKLVLVNDASALPLVNTSQLPVVDGEVSRARPVDVFVGPVENVPVGSSSFGTRTSSSIDVERNKLLLANRSLTGGAERIESSFERRATYLTARVSAEQSFSTAAELFDAHPESLDKVFGFETEDALVELI